MFGSSNLVWDVKDFEVNLLELQFALLQKGVEYAFPLSQEHQGQHLHEGGLL